MADDNHKESASKKTGLENVSLEEELHNLQEIGLAHLELEFENYKILYPLNLVPHALAFINR